MDSRGFSIWPSVVYDVHRLQILITGSYRMSCEATASGEPIRHGRKSSRLSTVECSPSHLVIPGHGLALWDG